MDTEIHGPSCRIRKISTPVCTTGARLHGPNQARVRQRIKVVGLSVDAVDNHSKWASDIKETQGTAPNYPIIGDSDLNVAKLYGMLPASASGDASKRTPAGFISRSAMFLWSVRIRRIKLILVYPMDATGAISTRFCG